LADGSALALGDQADKSKEANPAKSACRLQAAPNEAPLQLTGNREPELERTVTDDAECGGRRLGNLENLGTAGRPLGF